MYGRKSDWFEIFIILRLSKIYIACSILLHIEIALNSFFSENVKERITKSFTTDGF